MAIEINVEKIYNHWIESSDNDYNTMIHLFNSKDYSWSLFIGHIVIEKLLKASIIKETGNQALFSHDLTKLAQISKLDFDEGQLDMLDSITTFNINARYDSYKNAFYQRCTFEFTNKWIENINNLRLWIKAKQ